MVQININEIKRDLIAFLKKVEADETIIILKSGKPVAEIKPVSSKSTKQLRPFGLCAGNFIVPDDFDDPLPVY